jgi:hypothetical protein
MVERGRLKRLIREGIDSLALYLPYISLLYLGESSRREVLRFTTIVARCGGDR